MIDYSPEVESLWKKYPNADKIQNAPIKVRPNKAFMLTVLIDYSYMLEHASPELQSDVDFLLEAIEKNYVVLSYVSKHLRSDKGFIAKAIELNNRVKKFSLRK